MIEQEKCPDCGVDVGKLHKDGCDVEKCPICGFQYFSCDCPDSADSERQVWAGEWPE